MWKRIFGVLSLLGAALWPILWEFVRSLFYERGSHMLTPFINSITIDQIAHWGPTVGLSFLGLWLFWKTRSEKTVHGGDQANFRGIVGDQPIIGNPTSGVIESHPIHERIGPRDSHWQFDSQMAVEIAARLRNRPEWQDKIVDVTPEYLWDLFQRGRTSMDGSMLVERFINKWMVVCGPFGDVSVLGQITLVTFAFRNSPGLVFMYFNEDWRDRLEIIIQNNKIAIVGRIIRVINNDLQLADCEIVK